MRPILPLLAAAALLAACSGDARQQAMYCYKTLADVDCYTEPVPQDRRRLLGHLGPPPATVPTPAWQPPPPRAPDLAELWDADQLSR